MAGPNSQAVDPDNGDNVASVSEIEQQDHATEMQSDAYSTTPTDPLQQSQVFKPVSLENEMRVGRELPDGDEPVDGSLASKLILNLEAEQELTSKPQADFDRRSNLDYATDSGGGLTYTGYSQPASEEWPCQNNPVVDGDADAAFDVSAEPTQQTDEPDLGESDGNDPNAGETAAEDTIEAYMNRLLKHVRGDADENEASPESQSGYGGTHQDADSTWGPSKEDLEPLDPDVPLIPRSQAPERNTDLNTMRELANASARIAINRSARMQTRSTQLKGVISLVFAFGAIMCGIACYVFLPGMIGYLAAGMTVIVAIVYIWEAMQLFQEASYQYHAVTNVLLDEDEESDPVVTEEFADE